LHKFIKLVQNEIIKLAKKKGTLVMLILFVAAVIAFTGFCKIIAVSNSGDYDWPQESFQQGEVAGNVEYFRGLYEQSIVKDADGNILSFDMEMKQAYEYWQFIADKEIRYDDWLYTEELYSEYCMDKFALENGTAGELADVFSARVKQIESYMTENGWKLYYQAEVDRLLADGGDSDRDTLWFYQYALEKDIAPGSGELSALLNVVLQNKKSLAELIARKEAGDMISDVRIDEVKDDITFGIYCLENGITRDISADVKNSNLFELSDFNFWSVFAVCKTLIKIVGVMCIVIAGSIVAAEFSQGTYKFLLMSPAKRWKILVAKFVTVLLFGIVMLAALYLLSLLCCMVFFGTAELALPILSVRNGVIAASSPLLLVMGDYLLSTVEILAMAMLAFAISTLVKGNALAISASLLVFFSGSLIETLLRNFGVDFGRYLLFANLDLPTLYAGTELYAGQTFGFAVAVILCHLVVFGWTAWDAFTRREM